MNFGCFKNLFLVVTVFPPGMCDLFLLLVIPICTNWKHLLCATITAYPDLCFLWRGWHLLSYSQTPGLGQLAAKYGSNWPYPSLIWPELFGDSIQWFSTYKKHWNVVIVCFGRSGWHSGLIKCGMAWSFEQSLTAFKFHIEDVLAHGGQKWDVRQIDLNVGHMLWRKGN